MRRLLALLFVLALALSACGGDDGDGDDVASRGTTTTEAEDATDEEDADGKNAEDDENTDEEFTGKGSGDFCEKSRRYTEKFEDASASFGDADATRKQFGELEDALDDLAGEAPGEIETDVDVVVANFKELKALFEKYDYDFSKIPPEENAAFDEPEVEAANKRVNNYMETVCGIDTDRDGDTSGDDPETPDDTTAEG